MGLKPSWFKLIEEIQQKENIDTSSRWVQLATIAKDGTPRVRTIVLRGWNNNRNMFFTTDRRSNKVEEISKQPKVEICWLLRQSKCQFRFRGLAKEITGNNVKKILA